MKIERKKSTAQRKDRKLVIKKKHYKGVWTIFVLLDIFSILSLHIKKYFFCCFLLLRYLVLRLSFLYGKWCGIGWQVWNVEWSGFISVGGIFWDQNVLLKSTNISRMKNHKNLFESVKIKTNSKTDKYISIVLQGSTIDYENLEKSEKIYKIFENLQKS